MIEASCHCGAVKIEIPRRPRTLTDCNCSICRRYGTLWAYYAAREVVVRGARSAMASYAWGERSIRFVRCARCGCVTHWEPSKRPRSGRVGVNARNLAPQLIAGVRVRRLDGATTWKFLD
jgi:hypothetical protein